MRRIPAFLLASAALVALAAIGQHVRSRRVRGELERERAQLLADTRQMRTQSAELARQLEAGRTRRSAAAEPASTPSASTSTTLRAPSDAAATDLELRGWRVRIFIGEQRMHFAALLQRLGFNAAQRQAFDEIQEKYVEATLDETLAARRQQARDTRDAALRELFGSRHDAWLEANRTQPARALVAQIVQQTFPSSGALNAAQADELTRIVAQHRLAPAAAAAANTGYDWERIIADARTILADRQIEDFVAAVNFRRTSDEMSAIVARAKR